MNKAVPEVLETSLEILNHHNWPGNVRELQHFIDRALIRSSGPVLDIPIHEFTPRQRPDAVTVPTLDDAHRKHILNVLGQTGGVLSGRSGAAARLGLPRTTLIARMHRLGISQKRTAIEVSRPDTGVLA